MSPAGVGALLGLALMSGVLLVLARLRATRPLRLHERIAPYLPQRVASDQRTQGETLLALLRPGLRLVSGGGGLAGRLQRAGRPEDRARYWLEQLVAAAVGAAIGLMVGLVLAMRGSSLIGALLLGAVGAVLGVLVHDRRLTGQGRARQRRIAQQLPTVAELLAFAVSAGESPAAALERVGRTTAGDLSDELRRALVDLRGGAGFQEALQGISRRCGTPEVERFIDGIVLSIERGTPVAEVLRAQAADARAAQNRALVEAGGKRDSAMLVPVVFLILPIVVVVALFPGFQTLQLVVP